MSTYYRSPEIQPSALRPDKIAVLYRNFVWYFIDRTVAMQFAVEAVTLDGELPARMGEAAWYSNMCSLARMCESGNEPIGTPDLEAPVVIYGLWVIDASVPPVPDGYDLIDGLIRIS